MVILARRISSSVSERSADFTCSPAGNRFMVNGIPNLRYIGAPTLTISCASSILTNPPPGPGVVMYMSIGMLIAWRMDAICARVRSEGMLNVPAPIFSSNFAEAGLHCPIEKDTLKRLSFGNSPFFRISFRTQSSPSSATKKLLIPALAARRTFSIE